MPADRVRSCRRLSSRARLLCRVFIVAVTGLTAGEATAQAVTSQAVTSQAVTSSTAAAAPGSWSLWDGDRVVLLGDAFVEREGDRGFIETALVAAHPEAAVTFRNLGWSGDTVWAESRGVFDQPAKGYARMLALVKDLAPTLVFVAYGRNESYRGAAGLPAFRSQLEKLCADLRSTRAVAAAGERQPAEIRLVLVTPHRFETTDADARNAALAPYCQAIREVAAAQRTGLVDLFAEPAGPTAAGSARTENGVHLSDSGYAAAAEAFVRASGRRLPPDFASASAALRKLVVEKNRLFFHRWRPANETYIFLFRSHEQGNNAVEISQFDPLVATAEERVRAVARGSTQP
jgi:lysophospholipase L1-like esterase